MATHKLYNLQFVNEKWDDIFWKSANHFDNKDTNLSIVLTLILSQGYHTVLADVTIPAMNQHLITNQTYVESFGFIMMKCQNGIATLDDTTFIQSLPVQDLMEIFKEWNQFIAEKPHHGKSNF